MTRILIVEDNAEKLRRVTRCLIEIEGIDFDMISDARDASSAKKLMKTYRYDLLILDISIPLRADELPNHDSGLNLLREILERDIYETPVQIVGLTAFAEALDVARPLFEADVLQVVHYDPFSEEWAERLVRIAKRVLDQSIRPISTPTYAMHLCIITALASPELQAVLALPWNWTAHARPHDPTAYHHGWFMKGDQRREVIAAAAPRMGMQASGVLAMKMAMAFQPKYVAMAGILAGIRGECQLGDVIVADPSWDYGSGKHSARDGAPAFASAPHQSGLDPFLRGRLGRMAQDTAMMDQIRREWRGEARHSLLSMRLGPVASGAAVLTNEKVVDQIRSQHRKTLGIEMETYGVYVAAEECPEPRPRCFSIKSVCDFADESKNDAHQSYAAYTSAAALRYFCESYLEL